MEATQPPGCLLLQGYCRLLQAYRWWRLPLLLLLLLLQR
jgi:hypothetical protein